MAIVKADIKVCNVEISIQRGHIALHGCTGDYIKTPAASLGATDVMGILSTKAKAMAIFSQ